MNVSDFLLKRLSAWGVRIVYGFPGDGISGVMGAFNRNDHGIRFIQARHEEMAAFMACAHAKSTGEVGRLGQEVRIVSRSEPACDEVLGARQ